MTKDELWQLVLGELELSLSKASFDTWFKNTFIAALENEQVIIGVPNLFTQAWFEKKYHELIIKTLKKITNNQVKNIIYIEFHMGNHKYYDKIRKELSLKQSSS